MVSATKGAPKTAEDHLTQGLRVSAIHVRGMCEAIQDAGHSLDPFLARAKLDLSQLADRGGWIGLAEFARLLREAVRYTRDPAFGLHWGERSPMLQYDVGPMLVANAANLRGAIDALLELQLIFVDRTQCCLVQSGRRSELRLDPFAVDELHRRVVSELAFAAIVRIFRYFGEERAVQQIGFAYARPPYHAEYERVFGPRISYDQAKTSFVFDSAALERPLRLRSEELHRVVRHGAAELRQRVLGQLSYAEQLEGHVRAALPHVLTVEEAARAFAISGRSLRRRLKEERLSFFQLVDDVQRRRANELLAVGELSVKEIAKALGFATVGGFNRAHRRWTGQSPGRSRASSARR